MDFNQDLDYSADIAKKKIKLRKDRDMDAGFGNVTITFTYASPRMVKVEFIGGDECYLYPTVSEIEKEYSEFLKYAKSTIFFNVPLSDELYLYDRRDNEWYLVRTGQGFA